MKKNFKILHVGNIANNAYNNSKLLREKNIKSDVICYDYYHIMGTPEWEDAEIKGDYGDDFNPDFLKVDLNGFKRPIWFMQGNLEEIAKKYYNLSEKKEIDEFVLGIINQHLILKNNSNFYKKYQKYFRCKIYPKAPQIIEIIYKNKQKIIYYLLIILKIILDQLITKETYQKRAKENAYFQSLVQDFNKYFPNRKDKLTMSNIQTYKGKVNLFRKIFQKYDIVQCYACDPIWPMLANYRPYIAYEHGTLRNIPFEKTPIGKLTALAYRKADLVFITNSDNIRAAKKLGLQNFVHIPHPINDTIHKNIHHNNNLTKILLCPTRHDWKMKNIHFFIKAIPEVVKKTNIPFKVILIEWGTEIERSKKLIKKLGVEKYVEWRRTIPRKKLSLMMKQADIILDQAFWVSMGGIGPEGMLAGKPVLTSYDHNLNKWMYPEKPPLIDVRSTKDIQEALISLLNNPEKRKKIGQEGINWYQRYHSKQVVVKKLLKNYDRLLNKYQK